MHPKPMQQMDSTHKLKQHNMEGRMAAQKQNVQHLASETSCIITSRTMRPERLQGHMAMSHTVPGQAHHTVRAAAQLASRQAFRTASSRKAGVCNCQLQLHYRCTHASVNPKLLSWISHPKPYTQMQPACAKHRSGQQQPANVVGISSRGCLLQPTGWEPRLEQCSVSKLWGPCNHTS